MLKYILKRLSFGVITVFIVSIVIFSIIHLLPGDPIAIMFGKNPNPENMEIVRKFYGFDRPIIVQYFSWIGKIFQGDLGYSILNGQPVSDLITVRIGRTLTLTVFGILFSLILAIPGGIIASWKHNTWTDFSLTSVSLLLVSIPEFWIGIILMIIFSVWLSVLPTSGYVPPTESIIGWLKTLILPSLSVAAVTAAETTRMIRANMLDVLGLDYITLMKSSGVKNHRLLLIHAFRNAFIPVITLIGLQVGYLMGGVIIIEQVFTFPGLGQLLIKSLAQRDYPIIQACIMFYSIFFIFINIVVDVLYAFINPKIRY